MIVDPSGIILTNNHVVAGGGDITVRLSDGREFKAGQIKTDPKTDVAIVRIDAGGPLPVAKLGRSSEVEVGDWVLALGQPFGLEGTVTAGIVSAKGRGLGITDREDFIQTDAAINPGNSGGPLVNLDGEVIGINTAISTSSGGYQGVGFAVPIDLAKWVGGQLETKRRRSPRLAGRGDPAGHARGGRGVQGQGPLRRDGPRGPQQHARSEGRRAAGRRDPEVRRPVGERPAGAAEYRRAFADRQFPADGRAARRQADDHQRDLQRAARRRHGLDQPVGPGEGGSRSSFEDLGIEAETLTGSLAEQLGVKADSGVAITEVRPGSPAAMAGLAKGMVITQANRKPVKSPADLRKAIEAKPLSEGLLLMVRTEEGNRMVLLRVGG